MSVGYQITGYDKKTERLAREYSVPEDSLGLVFEIAHIAPPMIADFSSVPLTPAVVRQIGRSLHRDIYSDYYDWFLEPFAA
jgi:hypothetical protein